jgi:hypothetical protein
MNNYDDTISLMISIINGLNDYEDNKGDILTRLPVSLFVKKHVSEFLSNRFIEFVNNEDKELQTDLVVRLWENLMQH